MEDSRYRLEGRIATGTASRVYRATRVADNAKVILKRFLKVSDALHEARVYETLKGVDGVLPVLDCSRLYLVFPDLGEHIQPLHLALPRMRPMQDPVILLTRVAQILSAIHERRILHRDLKEDNLLVDTRNWSHCWIIDFHLSDILRDPGDSSVRLLFGLRTRTPPEHFRRSGAGLAWDVWQFGVLAARLFSAHYNFWPVSFPLPPMPLDWTLPVLAPTDRMLLAASHEPPRPPSYRLSKEALWVYHCMCEHDPTWIPLPTQCSPGVVELIRTCTRSSPYDRPRIHWILDRSIPQRPRLMIRPRYVGPPPAESDSGSGGASHASGEGTTLEVSEAITGPTEAAKAAGSEAARP